MWNGSRLITCSFYNKIVLLFFFWKKIVCGLLHWPWVDCLRSSTKQQDYHTWLSTEPIFYKDVLVYPNLFWLFTVEYNQKENYLDVIVTSGTVRLPNLPWCLLTPPQPIFYKDVLVNPNLFPEKNSGLSFFSFIEYIVKWFPKNHDF